MSAHIPNLKPCPCCGGDAWVDLCNAYTQEMGRRDYWSVRCKDCDLRTPAIANPKSPVLIWNTRPSSDERTLIGPEQVKA